MSLPDRQQQILDQIEQALHSGDPALRSMYAMFGRLTAPEAMPTIEAMPGESAADSAGAGRASEAGRPIGAGEAEATAATAGAMAVTGATAKSAAAGTGRKARSPWVTVGVVGPFASRAGVASTAASRQRTRRVVAISVIVLGMLGLMIFNLVSTGSQCPGLSSDQAVASAAVRYAACNHSTDAWSKGAR